LAARRTGLAVTAYRRQSKNEKMTVKSIQQSSGGGYFVKQKCDHEFFYIGGGIISCWRCGKEESITTNEPCKKSSTKSDTTSGKSGFSSDAAQSVTPD